MFSDVEEDSDEDEDEECSQAMMEDEIDADYADNISDDDERAAVKEAMASWEDARKSEKTNRRTMVQARAVLRDVRSRRKFFPPRQGEQETRRPGRDSGRARETEKPRGTVCLKCGGKHRTEDHGKPAKNTGTQLASYAYAFPAIEIGRGEDALLTLREEAKGRLVLDCGATASMGSVMAFEDFCDAVAEAGKTPDIQVNPHVKTRFRFGD